MVLIADYRTAHVPPEHPLLLRRENGRPLDRHTVTRFINKAGATAALPHIHPHQLRHTLATQAINRGMSLEAIAAMLGHRSMDMTRRYAKIANRTMADEYLAVTDQVDALYAKADPLPADAIGPKMASCAASTTESRPGPRPCRRGARPNAGARWMRARHNRITLRISRTWMGTRSAGRRGIHECAATRPGCSKWRASGPLARAGGQARGPADSAELWQLAGAGDLLGDLNELAVGVRRDSPQVVE